MHEKYTSELMYVCSNLTERCDCGIAKNLENHVQRYIHICVEFKVWNVSVFFNGSNKL